MIGCTMTYPGHIENGVAVLDEGIVLPDGTPVRVEAVPQGESFWHGKSAAELARDQGIQPLQLTEDLAIDWPPEDSIDDLMAVVREDADWHRAAYQQFLKNDGPDDADYDACR
jgi:hypothetical protein